MTITDAYRLSRFEKENWQCWYCRISIQTYADVTAGGNPAHLATLDHEDPDGGDDDDNLVVACLGCNAAKGHRTFQQWVLDMDRTRLYCPECTLHSVTPTDVMVPS